MAPSHQHPPEAAQMCTTSRTPAAMFFSRATHWAAACVFAGASLSVTAQTSAPKFLSASSLALSCARVGPNQPLKNDAEATCVTRMLSFLDGWRAGALRGVTVALIHDSPVFMQGVEPFRRRVEWITPMARCVGDEATIFPMISAFLDYMAMHPERAQDHYAAVLPDAMDPLCK